MRDRDQSLLRRRHSFSRCQRLAEKTRLNQPRDRCSHQKERFPDVTLTSRFIAFQVSSGITVFYREKISISRFDGKIMTGLQFDG